MIDSTTSTRTPHTPTLASARFDVAALKRSFDEDGYVVLRGVVSRSELQTVATRLASEFAQWKASTASFRGGGLMSGHLNCYPCEVARGVFQQLTESGAFALARPPYGTAACRTIRARRGRCSPSLWAKST